MLKVVVVDLLVENVVVVARDVLKVVVVDLVVLYVVVVLRLVENVVVVLCDVVCDV